MRAAVLVEPGRFELRDLPRPELGPGEVLIRVERAGICGTDLHIFHGRYAAESLPMVPGHEFAGRVEALGPGAEGLREGQPAVVDINVGCTRCLWCRRNEVLNCPEVSQIGITSDGAFAEFVAVPARLVIPAPEGVPAEILALTEPFACVVRSARKAGATFGQSVAVIGAGPIGNLHVQLMRAIGAAPVIACDVSEGRRELALQCGADAAVHPDGFKDAVMAATGGRGVDIAIESVGKSEVYALAMESIRRGGHLAAFGLTVGGETLPLDILETVLREDSLKGSVAGMGEDMHDSLTLLSHGRVRTEAFTRAAYPLEDIQEAFDSVPNRPADLKTQIAVI